MEKFVFLHVGFVPPTPEIGQAWMAWFESIKDKIVDSGSPFGPGREITKDGTKDLSLDIDAFTGYTIINAADLDEATEIAATCPSITGIRVYPAMSM
jgi:hypothetical protein